MLKRAGTIVNFKSNDKNTFNVVNLTKDHFDEIQNIIENYSSQNLKTIGFDYRDFEQWPPKDMMQNVENEVPYEELVDKITLLSILGIEDLLKEGIRDDVQTCINAGINFHMFTNDNVITAKSITAQCGIYTNGEVMKESIFCNLPLEEMDKILPRLQVLATSTLQKPYKSQQYRIDIKSISLRYLYHSFTIIVSRSLSLC